jgi:hypothetical protein
VSSLSHTTQSFHSNTLQYQYNCNCLFYSCRYKTNHSTSSTPYIHSQRQPSKKGADDNRTQQNIAESSLLIQRNLSTSYASLTQLSLSILQLPILDKLSQQQQQQQHTLFAFQRQICLTRQASRRRRHSVPIELRCSRIQSLTTAADTTHNHQQQHNTHRPQTQRQDKANKPAPFIVRIGSNPIQSSPVESSPIQSSPIQQFLF